MDHITHHNLLYSFSLIGSEVEKIGEGRKLRVTSISSDYLITINNSPSWGRSSKGGDCAAARSGISIEALADPRGVVTPPSPSALVVSIVRLHHSRDITLAHINPAQFRGATISTELILERQQKLWTLRGDTWELDHDEESLIRRTKLGYRYINIGDNAIGEMFQGARDVELHRREVRGVEDDRLCCERFVETCLESQSKRLSIQIRESGNIWESSDEMQELGLVFDHHVIVRVRAVDHDIVSLWTESLGAVILCVSRITNTGTTLAFIPTIVVKEMECLSELIVIVIELNIAVAEGFNELTSAMARAVPRTGSSPTRFAFKSIKTITFSFLAITDSFSWALKIFVMGSIRIWEVNPWPSKGTNSIRAISIFMRIS
jgi:hypothetical protein